MRILYKTEILTNDIGQQNLGIVLNHNPDNTVMTSVELGLQMKHLFEQLHSFDWQSFDSFDI